VCAFGTRIAQSLAVIVTLPIFRRSLLGLALVVGFPMFFLQPREAEAKIKGCAETVAAEAADVNSLDLKSLLKAKGIDSGELHFVTKRRGDRTAILGRSIDLYVGKKRVANVDFTNYSELGKGYARMTSIEIFDEHYLGRNIGFTLYLVSAAESLFEWNALLGSSDDFSAAAARVWERLVNLRLAEKKKIRGEDHYLFLRSNFTAAELEKVRSFYLRRRWVPAELPAQK